MPKRIIPPALGCAALAFALPLLLIPAPAFSAAESAAEAAPTPAPEWAASPEPTPEEHTLRDRDMELSVLIGGEVSHETMAEYLPLALAGEMPAGFDEDALKAQAVALRTYALYCRSAEKPAHPDADICTSSGCCTAAADMDELRALWGSGFDGCWARICAAVEQTDGQYLVYNSEPILAAFHSSSSGMTESSADVWGERPYLVSVSSPETQENVKNLVTTVEVSADDFKSAVSGAADVVLGAEPGEWVGGIERNSSGRVKSAAVGGAELSGTLLRSLFSLRSTDFDLEYTDGMFVFTVRGYGHGVGMSQYGANTMAKDGASYAEILEHYYPGTELVVAVELG